jgi:hypothetical protein
VPVVRMIPVEGNRQSLSPPRMLGRCAQCFHRVFSGQRHMPRRGRHTQRRRHRRHRQRQTEHVIALRSRRRSSPTRVGPITPVRQHTSGHVAARSPSQTVLVRLPAIHSSAPALPHVRINTALPWFLPTRAALKMSAGGQELGGASQILALMLALDARNDARMPTTWCQRVVRPPRSGIPAGKRL